MSTKKEAGKASQKRSAVLDFLSGAGANPLPAGKRVKPGREEVAFVKEVDADVVAQDRENSEDKERPEPTAFEELIMVLRLMNDNQEMLALIEKGECSTVSDLAKRMNRELSNVSRTISKLGAYGIVGLIREGGAAKRPVLLMNLPKGSTGNDWAEAYCVARAVRHGGLMGLEANSLIAAEGIVSSLLAAAAKSFDQIAGAKPMAKSAKPIAR